MMPPLLDILSVQETFPNVRIYIGKCVEKLLWGSIKVPSIFAEIGRIESVWTAINLSIPAQLQDCSAPLFTMRSMPSSFSFVDHITIP